MKLEDIGIVLTPTFRAAAYLQNLIENDLIPGYALIIEGKKGMNMDKIEKENHHIFFKKFKDFEKLLKEHNIEYQKIQADNCNEKKVIDTLKKRDEKYMIYTGGGILKEAILSIGKKFIHVHPGLVPDYRGSTCMYYSILNENKCGATAFFMSLGLDLGEVLGKKEFEKPKTKNIDYEYDCYIRSSLLVDVIKNYGKHKKFETYKQDSAKGKNFYIIHPVLKHISILSCVGEDKK